VVVVAVTDEGPTAVACRLPAAGGHGTHRRHGVVDRDDRRRLAVRLPKETLWRRSRKALVVVALLTAMCFCRGPALRMARLRSNLAAGPGRRHQLRPSIAIPRLPSPRGSARSPGAVLVVVDHLCPRTQFGTVTSVCHVTAGSGCVIASATCFVGRQQHDHVTALDPQVRRNA